MTYRIFVAPDPVFSLTTNLTKLGKTENEFALSVAWGEPLLKPDNYSIEIIERNDRKGMIKTFSVSGVSLFLEM